MSGITSGVGLASGINSQQIIDQLMAIETRPKTQVQTRIRAFQLQQAAILDINSRLTRLRDAGKFFRDNKTFDLMKAISGDDKVLTASASAGAAPGTYQFIVDRLVTAQQSLSTGWSSKDTAVNATSFSFESAKARLDTDVSLADLNGGTGIARGKIVVTDSAGKSATIDLSKAGTVNDVLDAINNNGTAAVSASVYDGKFIIKDNAGGTGNVIVADAQGYTTASSLGIKGSAVAGASITGSDVYSLARGTSLASLNDGNGISIKPVNTDTGYNFSITVTGPGGPKTVNVNLSDVFKNETVDGKTTLVKKEGAVSTIGGVLDRINQALDAQGLSSVRAEITSDGKKLRINDASGTSTIAVAENGGTTAADLGLVGSASNTLNGTRLLAGLNSVMGKSLNGGKGIDGDGFVNFTTRDGFSFSVGGIVSQLSLDQIKKNIEDASGTTAGGKSRLTVSLNTQGTGLVITDNTGGNGKLIIEGTSGADTAASLKISTGAAGVASSTINSGNLQKQYISSATLVSSLNGGKGIGTGSFKITDGFGTSATVDIGDDTKTIADLVDEINSRGLKIKASINDQGDGIVIAESVAGGSPAGTSKMKIEDSTGSVAKALNLVGTASGVGASNKIDGSYERKIAFDATDTLANIVAKINAAAPGVNASVINDGSGATPFRLSFTSTGTGTAGRMIIDGGTTDLGLKTLENGQDARVFYGSTDPAKAVLITNSSNTLDNVISNVKIDLKSASTTPVSLTISSDYDSMKADISSFVAAFNDVISRIDSQSSYNSDTQAKGPLLGDTTLLSLRSALYSAVQGESTGVTTRYTRLTQVGVKVGAGGKLTLDEDALRTAINTDPAAVEALFTAHTAAPASTDVNAPVTKTTYSQLGVPGILEELSKKYVDSVDGVLTSKNKSLDNQISVSNKRIAALDDRLAQKRARLEAQFAAMEKAISQLQSQQGALSSIK